MGLSDITDVIDLLNLVSSIASKTISAADQKRFMYATLIHLKKSYTFNLDPYKLLPQHAKDQVIVNSAVWYCSQHIAEIDLDSVKMQVFSSDLLLGLGWLVVENDQGILGLRPLVRSVMALTGADKDASALYGIAREFLAGKVGTLLRVIAEDGDENIAKSDLRYLVIQLRRLNALSNNDYLSNSSIKK